MGFNTLSFRQIKYKQIIKEKTVGCTFSLKVVTDRNRSYYLSWNYTEWQDQSSQAIRQTICATYLPTMIHDWWYDPARPVTIYDLFATSCDLKS